MIREPQPTPVLLDRQRERAALDGLLGDLRSGRGRALVVRGEAGVGKSALLEYAAGAAADMRVVRRRRRRCWGSPRGGCWPSRWGWSSPRASRANSSGG